MEESVPVNADEQEAGGSVSLAGSVSVEESISVDADEQEASGSVSPAQEILFDKEKITGPVLNAHFEGNQSESHHCIEADPLAFAENDVTNDIDIPQPIASVLIFEERPSKNLGGRPEHGPQQCPKCGIILLQKHLLTNHLFKCGTEERTFNCEFPRCKKTYQTKKGLLQHYRQKKEHRMVTDE